MSLLQDTIAVAAPSAVAAALLGCPVISAAHEVEFDPWGPEFVPGEGFRDGSEMHLDGPTVAALLDAFTPSSCGESHILHLLRWK